MQSIKLCTAYWPSIAWYAAMWRAQTVELEAHEHYQKGSLRNRCYLPGPNGLMRLSIPLEKGKHQRLSIHSVKIAYDEPWQRQHWRSITAVYGSAPFFEHYADTIRIFYEKKYTYLFDFNAEILSFLNKALRWEGNIVTTESYEPFSSPVPLASDFRAAVNFDTELLPDWFLPARYGQVFQEVTGFVPNASILDLLMCRGRESAWILQKSVLV